MELKQKCKKKNDVTLTNVDVSVVQSVLLPNRHRFQLRLLDRLLVERFQPQELFLQLPFSFDQVASVSFQLPVFLQHNVIAKQGLWSSSNHIAGELFSLTGVKPGSKKKTGEKSEGEKEANRPFTGSRASVV